MQLDDVNGRVYSGPGAKSNRRMGREPGLSRRQSGAAATSQREGKLGWSRFPDVGLATFRIARCLSLPPGSCPGDQAPFHPGDIRYYAHDGGAPVCERRQNVRQKLLGAQAADLAGRPGLRPPIHVPAVGPGPPASGTNADGAFGVLHDATASLPSADGRIGVLPDELPCAHRQPALDFAGGFGHEEYGVVRRAEVLHNAVGDVGCR